MFTRDKHRREKILDFIHQYVEGHGYAPSVREIGDAVGIRSTRAVKYHLDILVRDKLIERIDGKARSLTTASRPYSLPLVGHIAAGSPILAIENIESHISMSDYKNSFLLRVRGESMRDAGIMHDDLVFVREQQEAHNGDIVAVMLGDEATVKTYRQKDDKVILQPANPDFEPVTVDKDSDEFRIIGVVTGLLRDYKPLRRNK